MMKRILACAIGIMTSLILSAQVKPVTGTWINLVWQDDRNNYMNPLEADNTDPALWELKVEELHEIGVDYLVLMQVADGGKSFYPSSIMPAAYDQQRKSPVEAIMDKAASLGMKVFLSCGWARNQDDDLRDPFVIERQRAIMDELARLYSESPAFYGWYLPVESSLEPVLPEHAVQGVNSLSAKARSLTPDKMVMISPYGICYADIDNPLFEERIAALDVDIIACQDEVGCVREPMPLPRMKDHFRKLGEIHSRTGIAFWANIESFTWEKPETNSRQSALVPASFCRYLSQMQAVSEAGAERIISFSVHGIFDKPYNNYLAWKSGDAKWKLFEQVCADNVISLPAVVEDGQYPALCDGVFGHESTNDPAWLSFPEGKMSLVLDLGEKTKITALASKFLQYSIEGVSLPAEVAFSLSKDGKRFGKQKSVKLDLCKNNLHDCWTDIRL